jgi:ribosome-binding protein aMBF1 (putative translation factor)
MKCEICGKECDGHLRAIQIISRQPWKWSRYTVCSEECARILFGKEVKDGV